jgi:hypothetical protein
VHWFSRVGDSPDVDTGMWVIKPDSTDDGENLVSIIHLDTVVRACQLIPIFGPQIVSRTLSCTDTLDSFTYFYVNKYVDHHAFEIAF